MRITGAYVAFLETLIILIKLIGSVGIRARAGLPPKGVPIAGVEGAGSDRRR